MITCGRCGKEAGIGGYGNNFRIFETFNCDGQKLGRRTDLCDDCQKQLVSWLNNGGYIENRQDPLPVRSTTMEIVKLRNKLDMVIDKLLEEKE